MDDKGNYLCIPEGEECPINDIIFSEIELPNLLEENYTYIYLDNIYVYYTNNITPVLNINKGRCYICVIDTL